MLGMPYFMENEDWYYFDGKRFCLTDKAPESAKKSLDEFYRAENKILYNEEGEIT